MKMSARFAIFYGAIFLTVGIYLPFWPAWLSFKGLDANEISLLFSVGIWARALITPIMGHFADHSGAHRKIIIITAGLSVISYFLFIFANDFNSIFLLNLLASTFFMSLIPLGENLASRASAKHGFDYGRARLWGSLTFILAAYLGGFAIEKSSDSAILWLIILAIIVAFIASLGLPQNTQNRSSRVRFPAFTLLTNKTFMIFIMAVGLIQSSHAVLYLFGTIHWRNADIPDHVIGGLWAEGVLAEIMLFAFSGRIIARISPVTLMSVAAGAGIIRWSILGTTADVTILMATQWLHGLTFGAAHLAAIHFMLRTVPDNMSASAQSLYSGLATGLIMGFVMLIAGSLYSAIGGQAFYAMIPLSFTGGILVIYLFRLKNR